MSIRTALTLVLEEYPKAISRAFVADAAAELLRKDVPQAIRDVIGTNDRYIIQGSPGQGNWARVPWVAIFDRLITESAQDGYYIVYLFNEGSSGVFISLNQGITSVKKQYGAKFKPALRAKASDFIARLGPLGSEFKTGAIDLASTGGANLSAYYEAGAICSKYYPRNGLPSDEVLNNDLREFVSLYSLLVSREAQLFERADPEEDEITLGEEDLRTLREHKRIERNRTLAQRAKFAHGYTCKACGLNFESKYGAIGRHYIEAHHLTPLHELKGQKITLSPKADFTVLCSNCHRMIHRTLVVNSVEQFRAQHIID